MKTPLLLVAPLFAAVPVHADTVVVPAAKDNSMYAESGSLANGKGSAIIAGVTAMNQVRRGLIAFDVAGQVPAGSTITSARLVLSMSLTISGPFDVSLHRVLADWGEGNSNATSGGGGMGAPASTGDATWTFRFFPTTLWASPGGDFNATASATIPVDQVADYTWGPTAALTADVQGWLDAPATSFGWIIIVDESVIPTAKRFDSRESSTMSARPELVIDFVPPCGNVTNYCIATANSTGQPAQISSSGSTSIAANSFTLLASSCPPNTYAVFFYGPSQTLASYGNGFRCIAGTLARLNPPILGTPAGTVARALDFTQPPASTIAPGSTQNFQLVYRDPAAGGALFNTTDGLSVVFCP